MRRTQKLFLVALLICGPSFAARPAAKAVSLEPEAEQWKGKPYDHQFNFGVMNGLGLVGANAGYSLYGTVAMKILHEGFLEDVNDQVYLEIMAGPMFMQGGTALFYAGHMRWDFHKNDLWSFYATGGFGGTAAGLFLGNYHMIHPRFALGALWNLFEQLSFRAELSHEFTGVGAVFLL